MNLKAIAVVSALLLVGIGSVAGKHYYTQHNTQQKIEQVVKKEPMVKTKVVKTKRSHKKIVKSTNCKLVNSYVRQYGRDAVQAYATQHGLSAQLAKCSR